MIKALIMGSAVAAVAVSVPLAAAGPTSAASQSYSDVDTVTIEEFVGKLVVRVGSGAAQAEIDGADEGGPLSIDQRGRSIVIEGPRRQVEDLYRRGTPYGSRWGGYSENSDAFLGFLEDYPTLTIRVPEGTRLVIDKAAVALDVQSGLGDIDLGSLVDVYGEIGETESADIGIGGRGHITLGDTGDLQVSIGGSGTVQAANAASARVSIGGSGDVVMASVARDVTVRVAGSGDVEAGDIGGAAEVSIHGSGDVELQDVAQGLDVSIHGSGDVEVSSAGGAVGLSIHGGGDIDIGGGTASAFQVSIHGSGDVSFDGVAADPSVSVHGSGDVVVEDYTGRINVRGDGDVRIGDVVFNDD